MPYHREEKVYSRTCPKCKHDSYFPEDGVMEGMSIPMSDQLKQEGINSIEDFHLIEEDEVLLLPMYWKCANEKCNHKLEVNFYLETKEDQLKDYKRKVTGIQALQEIDKEVIFPLTKKLAYVKVVDKEGLVDGKYTTVAYKGKLYSGTKVFWRLFKLECIPFE